MAKIQETSIRSARQSSKKKPRSTRQSSNKKTPTRKSSRKHINTRTNDVDINIHSMERRMDIQEQSGVHVLHPVGELTIFEAAEFKEALLALSKQEGPIELDMTDVERVDSSGIQLMVAASQDGRLTITGTPVALREKISAVGCTQLIKTSEK